MGFGKFINQFPILSKLAIKIKIFAITFVDIKRSFSIYRDILIDLQKISLKLF